MRRILMVWGLLSSSQLFADTLLGGEAGALHWSYSADGAYAESSQLTSFQFADTDETLFFAALEHPLPLLPNIKVRHNPITSRGQASLTSSFEFGDMTFPAGSDLDTQADLTHQDLILYYELLDNSLVALDLGANLKWVDGNIRASMSSLPGANADQNFQAVIPMVYGRLRADIMGTGLYGLAEANYINIDNNRVSDYQLGLGYALIDNLAFAVNLEAGVRVIDFRIEDIEDIYADFKVDGAWLGLAIDF